MARRSVNDALNRLSGDMRVVADCSDEELAALMEFAQAHSPVCNTVCRPVPVTIERMA